MGGLFITLDGPDGSGKSTQALALAERLSKMCEAKTLHFSGVLHVRQPGGTAAGEVIRNLILSGEHDLAPEAELFLFLADRAQHVKKVIIPSLCDNMIVICDRYTDSTYAYQGAGRNMDVPMSLLKSAECGATPDIRLIFQLPIDDAVKRLSKRMNEGGESNSMDLESIEFHKRVHSYYESLEYTPNIRRIDASKSPEEVSDIVTENVMDAIKEGYLGPRPTRGEILI